MFGEHVQEPPSDPILTFFSLLPDVRFGCISKDKVYSFRFSNLKVCGIQGGLLLLPCGVGTTGFESRAAWNFGVDSNGVLAVITLNDEDSLPAFQSDRYQVADCTA
ncbi:hypothetical protein AYX22_23645 (plasmid) [Arthrobacter sp. D5-1]|nr:hypothetical protein AYX22_23645 [Arthrobacter sp. D5-1]